MLRRYVCAAVAVLVLGGFVFAETIRGIITKIDGDKVSVTVGAKKGEKGEEKTFSLTAKTEYAKMKGKDDSEKATKDDLLKAVEKAAKGKGKLKGVFATLDVDGDKISKVSFRTGKGGKKGGGGTE